MDQRAAFEDTIALMEERIVTVRIDIDRAAIDESLWPAHLREMIGAVRSGSNPQDTESDFSEAKLGRWLGWAQASVVALGLASLDEMKALNKRHAAPKPSQILDNETVADLLDDGRFPLVGLSGKLDAIAKAAIEGEPEPDTETMQSYSAHEAEFPQAARRTVTPNAEA